MFTRDRGGQGHVVLLDQLLELEQDPGALQRRHLGPCRRGCAGSSHGGIDFVDAGQNHLCADFAGGWIEHILLAAARGFDQFAVDKVLKLHKDSFGVEWIFLELSAIRRDIPMSYPRIFISVAYDGWFPSA